MFGRAVFRDAAFHVVMCVFDVFVWLLWECVMGLLGSGGGCEYSYIGTVCLRVSLSKFSGRYGNLFVSMSKLIFWLLSFINSYMSLCIEFGGLISFWCVWVNSVYGCMCWMCLSGGFCKVVICSSSVVVQSGVGV